MKYVVFEGYNGEQIIIFPKKIQHSVMAADVEKSSYGTMYPISGGFIVNGECIGESESLRMQSRGDKDTALIAEMLCMNDNEQVQQKPQIAIKSPASKNKAKRLRKKLRLNQ